MFLKSLARRAAPSFDIQSWSPKKKSTPIFISIPRKIYYMLCTGCKGQPNKVQKPPSLLSSMLMTCFRYFFQADFYSQSSLRRPVSTLSINLLPRKKLFITFEGRMFQLKIFSAMQKKNREFLALSWMVSSSIFPEPAGERSIKCSTLVGYFSQQDALMYPPKLCPASTNDSMPTVFLHSSMASMQQLMVSSRVIFSLHLPLEESPTPKVSSACTWKQSLRCSKVLMKVSEVPPYPCSRTKCGFLATLTVYSSCMCQFSQMAMLRQRSSWSSSRWEYFRAS